MAMRQQSLIDLVTPAHAPTTTARYRASQRSWWTYCADRGLDPLSAPDSALISWLQERQRARPTNTGARLNLAALRALQRAASVRTDDALVPYTRAARPRLDAWFATHTTEGAVQRAPALLLPDLLRAIRRTLEDLSPKQAVSRERAAWLSARDAALLAVGWWGAFRIDDCARMQWSGVELHSEGVVIRLEDSKTGPCVVALARRPELGEACPVALLERWKMVAHAGFAPSVFVFRGRPIDLSRIVTRRTMFLLGPKTKRANRYRGHSLRAGFATEAARQGIDDRLVRRHARWLTPATHELYVREGRLWLDSPTRLIEVRRD